MTKIVNFITGFPLIGTKLIILILAYLLVRDIIPNVPYVNLLTKDLSGQLVVFGTFAVVLAKPSVNKLLILSGLLLFLNFLFTILELSWGGEEGFGLLIYIFLLFVIFKLLKGKL